MVRAIAMKAETLRNPNGRTCEDPERMRVESGSNSKLYELSQLNSSPTQSTSVGLL
jgi:hypothetical protein